MSAYCRLLLLIMALGWAGISTASVERATRSGSISLVERSVTIRRNEAGAAGPAALGNSVETGSIVETGPAARAELRIDTSTLHVEADSRIDFLQLDAQRVRLRLVQGKVSVSAPSAAIAAQFEVVTAQGSVTFADAGHYRVEFAGNTVLAALAGSARFTGRGLASAVAAGEQVTVSGRETLRASAARAGADRFSTWCQSRLSAAAPRATPHAMSKKAPKKAPRLARRAPRRDRDDDIEPARVVQWREPNTYPQVWYSTAVLVPDYPPRVYVETAPAAARAAPFAAPLYYGRDGWREARLHESRGRRHAYPLRAPQRRVYEGPHPQCCSRR